MRAVAPGLLAIATVTLLGPSVEPASASPAAFPGPNGEIALVRDHHRPDGGGNGTGIVAVRADGSDARWLVSGSGHDPSWSPDGRGLLFTRTSESTGNADLWLADANGRHETKISSFPYDFLSGSADWAPDGAHIAISGRDGIYVARLTGNRLDRLSRISRGQAIDESPIWSPSAPEIAYVNFRTGRDQLTIVGAAGGRPDVVATDDVIAGPSWSPDGRRLAFIRCTNHGSDQGSRLSVIRRDGHGERDLIALATLGKANGDCSGGQTAWSPNGKLIAYIASSGSGANLQVIAAEGKDSRVILRDVDGCCRISWQPAR